MWTAGIGFDNGVAVMDKGEFRFWGKMDGMKSAHTRAITEDENGTIYIATTCGIATIDADYNLAMLEDDLIAEANMRYITMGTDGLIYGLTNLGDIMTLKDGRLQSYIPAGENTVTAAVHGADDLEHRRQAVDLRLQRHRLCGKR